jgi:hypothetical protein
MNVLLKVAIAIGLIAFARIGAAKRALQLALD